ncbi:MAG: sensor histidine kinase [Terriglobia bacterium]
MDLADLLLLVWALVLFHRRPLGGRKIATAALAFVFAAALLHLGSCWGQDKESSVILWNFEQFTWSLSLFTFALAIGEASRNLFDKVFVRLQIAFILLASLMILVVVQTEKAEYLASVRGRSEHLLEFARAHVDYFQQQNKPLRAIVEREDFLEQMTLGFGNLAELKIVRIVAGRQAVSFEIAPTGIIRRLFETGVRPASLPSLDPDTYFFIQALPLRGAEPGVVEFYGTREFLNQHIRKRIVLIFSLFTGMVALSTLMIGLVVRGAGVTIRQQAQEIEEAQRRLMQASKMAAIGELASGVAHEINNPATTILSRASFLLSQQGRNSVPSDREDLEAIVSQAQRIAQITGGLLTFSRPHALDIRPVPIVRVIETSLRSLGALFAANHISVEKKLGLDLPRVLVDEDSLARALENIFRNAIDAMPSGGTLHIRTSTEDPAGARLRLEVSDSGIGIQGNHLGRIFDPFFTTKNVGKGAGLGLSIAHGILKEHHGTITVESQPGVGTRFTIILPTEQ